MIRNHAYLHRYLGFKSLSLRQIKRLDHFEPFYLAETGFEPEGSNTRSIASSRALAKNSALCCFLNASRPISPPNKKGSIISGLFYLAETGFEPKGSNARSIASSRALAKNSALCCFLNASRPISPPIRKKLDHFGPFLFGGDGIRT